MSKNNIMANDAIKEEKNEYTILKTINVGTKNKKGEPKRVLKRGDKISLTAKDAAIYKSQNII